jgi:membrane protease YdiL (CAAX protease family)
MTEAVGKPVSGRSIALFLAGFMLAWSVRATWLYFIDESIGSEGARLAYSALIKLGLWVVPAFAFAAWARRAPPLRYLGVLAWPRGVEWLYTATLIFIYVGAVANFEWLLNGNLPSKTHFLSMSRSAGISILLGAPVMEEILFRGLVLQELAQLMAWPAAIALTSLLFVVVHLPHWLWHGGPDISISARSSGLFVFSALAGYLYGLSRSVWPCVAANAANNALAAALVHA